MGRWLLLFFLLHNYLGAVDFVLFTQPKTATHLLIPILRDLTGKNVYWAPEETRSIEMFYGNSNDLFANQSSFVFNINRKPWDKTTMDRVWAINQSKGTFLHLHAPYSLAMESYLAEKNCVNFYIQRDPRDQIISLLNHYRNIHCSDQVIANIPSDNDRLSYMIKQHLRSQIHYFQWTHSPRCCVLSFEKLMGTYGSAATFGDAMDEMRKITSALKISISDKDLKKIYQKNFGRGWNFFRGKVGSWRDHLSEAQKQEVKTEIGNLLIALGYEKDLCW